ncbi:carbamoyl phosphate synthase small subunit [Apilactobacillus timberlakei]|uniref:carbamoyl phosphate synthase small subunit n=1 Tax=Apilactobacillus timberlakei TaxID=2008380 RepID=UPI000D03444C|nr:carbamoyl phosphate synthase small subunit [Apilactobacillus timberlakei]TPR13937.1 carbamoyl phosphate synthase small subunit [Apilactobacillus timberlakei]TPR16783.1 carbamoyl phosphate synthase small subunit [Apilactobacillus timberlakei]TPR17143.1 carbamoyl phosphate synthase small subunit [Apilactobacillus timberlakei]TPR20155.1 carbamoyl phosphate synthase small subunit [Apilactobacillus timberlakei]TPR21873.1 carbamoyl phosphate synthase small subunit [Apilactobacillus timberlakei]
MATRYLILEDGTSYKGKAFGSQATTTGEIVVNSNMLGYQEIITNQIYHNQIITFTQPSIGNTGINHKSFESIITNAKGIIVREYSNISTNRLGNLTLDRFLKQHNIPGIAGIDTRELTHRIRRNKSMKASIVDVNDEHAFDQLNAAVLTNQQVKQVSTKAPFPNTGDGYNIILIDFGLKYGILRRLAELDCNVIVMPWNTSSKEIMDLDPDGVILSTGPGSPNDLPESVLNMIRETQEKLPMFAMGLGHELFALANGAETYKLKVEHHGSNHPIRQIITNQIIYASQSQGYAVDPKSIKHDQLLITFIDLVNGTVQGIRHRDFPSFSVQFSPDGGPGPEDTVDLFEEFLENVSSQRR